MASNVGPHNEEANGKGSRGRTAMQNLWSKYSDKPTLESMMLNDKAAIISRRDEEQILSVLPDLKGKDVLELGAGIGRFTKHLVQKSGAGSLHVTDFIEKFIEANKAEYGHLPNLDFSVDDVTQLEFEDQSFDFIFTNWIFMYLTHEEVVDTVTNMMKWLRPGGKFHFRESCTESSSKLEHSNWRQVHTIVEKVPDTTGSMADLSPSRQALLSLIGKETVRNQELAAQRHWAAKRLLSGSISPLESYIVQCLAKCDLTQECNAVLSIGTMPQIAEASVYKIAELMPKAEIIHLETNACQYSVLLDEANAASSQDIRVLWASAPDQGSAFSSVLHNRFHCVFGSCVFFERSHSSAKKVLDNVTKCLKADGKIIFLEPSPTVNDGLILHSEILIEAGFTEMNIAVVTDDVKRSLEKSLRDAGTPTDLSGIEAELVKEWFSWYSQYPRWYLIQASRH